MLKSTALPPELARARDEIREKALELGLDFFEVIFEVVDFQKMNELAAYMGFPRRYPHWRWGMEYERLKRSYEYGLHKIYEMVINNDPCYAYLLVNNELVDQKIVMAHVYAHSDFFKNNLWFAHTNRRMLDEMANHATRISRYIDRYGLEEVEDFIDVCLSLENLIDRHSVAIRRHRPAVSPVPWDDEEDDEDLAMRRPEVPRLRVRGEYMDRYINPPELLRAEAERRREEARKRSERFPPEPERDVLLFLLEHAPLKPWQHDVLSIIREEAYYFAPQGMTKIMNEGWACATGDTLVPTNLGLLRLDEIVQNRLPVWVSDGERPRRVYDWAMFENEPTVRITTRRGFTLEGSVTHRVRLADGSWKRLDELTPGDRLQIAPPVDLWPSTLQPISWEPPRRRMTLEDVAAEVGVDISTVIRHRQGRFRSRRAEALDAALATYEEDLATLPSQRPRISIQVPAFLDEALAEFFGYLISDGHVSSRKREVGFTTGDEELAQRVAQLGEHLFGLESSVKRDGSRWRVRFFSRTLIAFCRAMGLTDGPSASRKQVPPLILRSPREVVSAFLRAYFDGDGYAGRQGVILSTSSSALAQQVQLLLLQFGILSRRRRSHGAWHLHITGLSAQRFAETIGFNLSRKQEALKAYLENRRWFKRESWTDEVVKVTHGTATVYDLSVEETHRYAANGLLNHNSYWHSTIMTQTGVMTDAEVVDYADHHSGTVAMSMYRINPYKIGLELFRDIEERWNKGQFGKEWEECDDMQAKREWDLQLGLGRQKIFEVRRIYNDVGFIDTFFTEDFCNRHKLFTYKYNERTNRYEIDSRDFQVIKQKLLFSLTNFGQPIIYVADANFRNRGELYLVHQYEGVALDLDYARPTLVNLYRIWKRPVHVETIVDDVPRLLSFDGKEHSFRKLDKRRMI